MGLLQRRSVFVNDEPDVKKDKDKGRRGRKSSMPSPKSPPQVNGKELRELGTRRADVWKVADRAAKRKSLVNILRSWKKDDHNVPPPLPMPNASFSRGRDSAIPSPTSPFETRPMSHFENNGSQAGICSTFPVQQGPAYASSVVLPDFIPGPRRFYGQGGAGPATSTSSFGASRSTLHLSSPAHRYGTVNGPPSPMNISGPIHLSNPPPMPSSGPMTISGPIPGIGDVPPTRYNDFVVPPPSEIGVALTPPPESPHSTLKKRESRQRIARLSTQTTQTMTTASTHASSNTSQSNHSAVPMPRSAAHSRRQSAQVAGQQVGGSPDGQTRPPQSGEASSRQSVQTIKPATVASRVHSTRASEADFLVDAEIAALLTEAQLPPPLEMPGVAAARAALEGHNGIPPAPEPWPPVPTHNPSPMPPRRSSAKPEMTGLPPPPRQSFTSLRPPPRSTPDPMPSYTSSSTSSTSTPTMHTPPTHTPTSPSPPTERLPAPSSPRPDSLLSTASWGSSAATRIGRGNGRVEHSSLPWMRRDSSPNTDVSMSGYDTGIEQMEALDETPKKQQQNGGGKGGDDESMRSTSSLSHCPTALLSPASSVAHSPSNSGSDYTSLGLGVIVPGPRAVTPSREIAGLKTRNSVLETTNARLEAELRKARSDAGLRSRSTSMYSIHSALTVRDDTSVGWPNHPLSVYSNKDLDLAMPALVAEIDQLKRSGAMLQAELQAVKSQVSLLLPPTPLELAKTEEQDGYVHGEGYVPSESYVPPKGHLQEIHSDLDSNLHESDADDERDTPTPHALQGTGNGHTRQPSAGHSDMDNSVSSHYSNSSNYSSSSTDSASPLTPDTSTDWPVLPPIMSLAHDSEGADSVLTGSGFAGDRSSVISVTSGGAPLTKLPVRTHSRRGAPNARVAPLNVNKANALRANGSDPTTPKARPRGPRSSMQPPPRGALTPRSTMSPRTSVYNMGNGIAPPPRPPRRRPVTTAVQRDTIVEVGA